MRHRRGVSMVAAALAVSVVAVAIGAITSPAAARAAADRQASIVERKVSCATEQGALQIIAFARNPVAGAASAVIDTGDPNLPTALVGVDTRYKHFVLGKSCRRVSRRIALTHRGLTSAGVVRAGNKRSPTVYCSATAHVRIHFKLSFDSAGKPVSATMAVRTQPKAHNGKRPKSKPIGYVQWSPQRSVTYYSRACTSQD